MHTITQCWPASSPIAKLFIEISDYNTQTTTNKYISEDNLANYYVTLHIGTQIYFNSSQSTSFLLERKRLGQQVLELCESESCRCEMRARGWKLRSILRLNKQLIGSRNNQIPNCIIHGLVHNNVCDQSNRRKDTISDNTMDLKLGAPHATETASVPAFARRGRSVTSLTRANCLLQQASSTKISVVC